MIYNICIIELIESALGSYFMELQDDSRGNDYRAKVELLIRRFFYKLLRAERFEKAFRIAIDIEARDLFMVTT